MGSGFFCLKNISVGGDEPLARVNPFGGSMPRTTLILTTAQQVMKSEALSRSRFDFFK